MKFCITCILGLTLFLCCGKTMVTEIEGGPTRYIDSHGAVAGSTVCVITVENEPGDLLVILNSADTMTQESHSGSNYVFKDHNIPVVNNEYRVDISADGQTISAVSTLPDSFDIDLPPDSVFVSTSIEIQWTAATHAEWYKIDVLFLYFDTSYTFIAVDTSVVTTDLSVEIEADWFTSFVGEGDMLIDVYARSGTHPDSSASNIEGADGAWIASHGKRKRVTVFPQ